MFQRLGATSRKPRWRGHLHPSPTFFRMWRLWTPHANAQPPMFQRLVRLVCDGWFARTTRQTSQNSDKLKKAVVSPYILLDVGRNMCMRNVLQNCRVDVLKGIQDIHDLLEAGGFWFSSQICSDFDDLIGACRVEWGVQRSPQASHPERGRRRVKISPASRFSQVAPRRWDIGKRKFKLKNRQMKKY